jgi:hypothetical protein
MDDLSADDLYEGLLAHGLFCEKLPPVFTSSKFLSIAKNIRHRFLISRESTSFLTA